MMVPARKRVLVSAYLAGIVLVSFLVVRGTVARLASSRDEPPELIPESRRSDSRIGSSPLHGGSSLDLLDRVQTSRDGIAGVWGFQNRALITPAVRRGRLQLPCVPPEEYDLRFVVTRKRGTNALVVGFVQSGRQGVAVLDGLDGLKSWVFLAGVGSYDSNPTRRDGKLLKWNKEAEVLLSVRRSGVVISVDAKDVVTWKGDPEELSLPSEFAVPHPGALFVGSWETVYQLDEIGLTPITGVPTLLR
jgi:hypothetical protein